MEKNRLTIYMTSNCYKCKQLVNELKEKGTDFVSIDINTLTTDELDILIKKHGASLPIKVEVKEC